MADGEAITSLQRLECIFASAETPVDYRSPEVVAALKAHNPSLLLEHYRRTQQKDRAIQLLLSMRRAGRTVRIAQEIIYTYVFFNDPEGALNYIKHYELTNTGLGPAESLIRLSTARLAPTDDGQFALLVTSGLEAGYAESLVRMLVERFAGSRCALRARLLQIGRVFTEAYVGRLSYGEALYLYRLMPHKARFLRRMVKTNPQIPRKYYFAYARRFGIDRSDILRIVSVRPRRWALRIAYAKGWIEPAMRAAVESLAGPTAVCINQQAEWSHRGDREGILFMRMDPAKE
ncbi:hypothetical protein PAPHI01_2410 [Pancytospora philotis]|nr:hypothetical protein PAPHI01_2410 [Pancytospora philotis]